jgi:hypothetical protein
VKFSLEALIDDKRIKQLQIQLVIDMMWHSSTKIMILYSGVVDNDYIFDKIVLFPHINRRVIFVIPDLTLKIN